MCGSWFGGMKGHSCRHSRIWAFWPGSCLHTWDEREFCAPLSCFCQQIMLRTWFYQGNAYCIGITVGAAWGITFLHLNSVFLLIKHCWGFEIVAEGTFVWTVTSRVRSRTSGWGNSNWKGFPCDILRWLSSGSWGVLLNCAINVCDVCVCVWCRNWN